MNAGKVPENVWPVFTIQKNIYERFPLWHAV